MTHLIRRYRAVHAGWSRNGVSPKKGIDTSVERYSFNSLIGGRNGVSPKKGIDTVHPHVPQHSLEHGRNGVSPKKGIDTAHVWSLKSYP